MKEKSNDYLIMDAGTYSCKVGFSSEETPTVCSPVIYGYPIAQVGQNPIFNYYGSEVNQHSSSLNIKEIYESGTQFPIKLLEGFWQNLFLSQFELESLPHPIIISQPMSLSPHRKEKLCELFFETFDAPAFLIVPSPMAGIFSSGRISGIVVDCGHSFTSVTSITDGTPFACASEYQLFGGREITNYIQTNLRCSRNTARKIKEDVDFEELEMNESEQKKLFSNFLLPDGTSFSQVKKVYDQAYEGLFKPDCIGLGKPGLHEVLFSSILKNDSDFRRELIGNVIIGGGNSCFPNFNERFNREISQMLPNIQKVKIFAFDKFA